MNYSNYEKTASFATVQLQYSWMLSWIINDHLHLYIRNHHLSSILFLQDHQDVKNNVDDIPIAILLNYISYEDLWSMSTSI